MEKRIDLRDLDMPTVSRLYGIDMAHEVRVFAWERLVSWQEHGGVAVAPAIVVGNPEYASLFDLFWDDPEKLMGYVVSWGVPFLLYVW